MRHLLALLAAPLLVLAACGDDTIDAGGTDVGDTSPTTSPAAGDPLAGRTFVGGEGLPLVPGTELRLAFADGGLGLQAGCNQLSGGYQVAGDTLTVEPVSGTEMGCEPTLMDQDTRIAALFAAPVTWALDGDTLTLATTDGTTVTLTDEEVAVPDADLVGPTWRLDTIIDGAGPDGTASSVPSDVTATITFGDDDLVGFETGCNTGSATYALDGDTVTLTDLSVEEAGCDGTPAGPVEDAVLAVLGSEGQPVAWATDGPTLTLTAADGAHAIGYRPSP